MEFIFEIIIDLLIEGSIGISSNKKVSKWIRYPIIVLLITFILAVDFGILLCGIFALNENLAAGIFMIIVSIVLLIATILQYRKTYLKKKDDIQEHKKKS